METLIYSVHCRFNRGFVTLRIESISWVGIFPYWGIFEPGYVPEWRQHINWRMLLQGFGRLCSGWARSC